MNNVKYVPYSGQSLWGFKFCNFAMWLNSKKFSLCEMFSPKRDKPDFWMKLQYFNHEIFDFEQNCGTWVTHWRHMGDTWVTTALQHDDEYGVNIMIHLTPLGTRTGLRILWNKQVTQRSNYRVPKINNTWFKILN